MWSVNILRSNSEAKTDEKGWVLHQSPHSSGAYCATARPLFTAVVVQRGEWLQVSSYHDNTYRATTLPAYRFNCGKAPQKQSQSAALQRRTQKTPPKKNNPLVARGARAPKATSLFSRVFFFYYFFTRFRRRCGSWGMKKKQTHIFIREEHLHNARFGHHHRGLVKMRTCAAFLARG